MKANYRHKSNRKKILKIILSILLSLILLYFIGGFIGKIVSYVSVPIYNIKNWSVESTGSVPSYFRDRAILIDTIASLEAKLSVQNTQSLTLARVLDENDNLRNLLGDVKEDRIVAGVIARPPMMPYDAILIDRGSNDGILEGAVVYHSNDSAIGFVAKTYLGSSLVTLFSTPGVEESVYVIGPDIYTTAYGDGGGIMRVSIPQGVSINIGDIIILPSLDSGVLGSIQTIESVITKPEQIGYFAFDVPLQSLKVVSVGRRAQNIISFEEAEKHVSEFKEELFKIDIPDEIIVTTGTSSTSPIQKGGVIEEYVE